MFKIENGNDESFAKALSLVMKKETNGANVVTTALSSDGDRKELEVILSATTGKNVVMDKQASDKIHALANEEWKDVEGIDTTGLSFSVTYYKANEELNTGLALQTMTNKTPLEGTFINSHVMSEEKGLYNLRQETAFVNLGSRDRTPGGGLTDSTKIPLSITSKDHTILGGRENNIVPEFMNSGVPLTALYGDLKDKVIVSGKEFLTAPIRTGIDAIDLISINGGIVMNTGTQDHTDTLSEGAFVKFIYVEISNGTVTELIKLSTGFHKDNNFVSTENGNADGRVLSMDTIGLGINTSNARVVEACRTKATKTSVILNDIGANTNIMFKGTVSGSLAIEGGDFTVAEAKLSLDSASTGSTPASNPVMTKINAMFANGVKVVAVEVEATMRLDNYRAEAVEVISINSGVKHGIPVTAALLVTTVLAKDKKDLIVEGSTITRGAMDVMKMLSTTAAVQKANSEITFVLDVKEALEAAEEGIGVKNATFGGTSTNIVLNYYNSVDVPMASATSTSDSKNKTSNISGALGSPVKIGVLKMIDESNFRAAAGTSKLSTGKKITIALLTSSIIAGNLDIKSLGLDDYNVVVIATSDDRLNEKIIAVPTMDTNIANPLNFGVRLERKNVAIPFTNYKGSGLSTSNYLIIREKFITNHFCMTEFNVTGLEDASIQ